MGSAILLLLVPFLVYLAGMVSGILFAVNPANRTRYRAYSFLPLVSAVVPFGIFALGVLVPPSRGASVTSGEGIWLGAMVVGPLVLAAWSARVLNYNPVQFVLHVLVPPVAAILLAMGCFYFAALGDFL
jgi:hypothetical protein